MGRPHGRHGEEGGDGDDEDDFEDDEEEEGENVGPGVMGGAPQYMWWRDYPRQACLRFVVVGLFVFGHKHDIAVGVSSSSMREPITIN